MIKLDNCPICNGKTAWCGERDEEDIHDCHFIICTGTCGTQFDTIADDNLGTIEEMKMLAAKKFNGRSFIDDAVKEMLYPHEDGTDDK